jgi:hypothetical protein
LDGTRVRLHQLAPGVDEAAWSRRPSPPGWSVGHCVAHINLTAVEFLPRLERAVAAGRPPTNAGTGRFKLGALGWLFVKLLEPPVRFRVRTPAALDPAEPPPLASALAEFDRHHDALDRLIVGAGGLPLDRLKVISPFDPRQRMRYSVYLALRIIPAHERRHLWQAEQVLKSLAR